MYVEYDSNNSGGRWWLTDEQWRKLEAGDWVVLWVATKRHKMTTAGEYERAAGGMPIIEDGQAQWLRPDSKGRWLGALATHAFREGLKLREAAEEWERLTGASSTDAGCPCCGPPHSFTQYDDDGKWVANGPDTSYSAEW